MVLFDGLHEADFEIEEHARLFAGAQPWDALHDIAQIMRDWFLGVGDNREGAAQTCRPYLRSLCFVFRVVSFSN